MELGYVMIKTRFSSQLINRSLGNVMSGYLWNLCNLTVIVLKIYGPEEKKNKPNIFANILIQMLTLKISCFYSNEQHNEA